MNPKTHPSLNEVLQALGRSLHRLRHNERSAAQWRFYLVAFACLAAGILGAAVVTPFADWYYSQLPTAAYDAQTGCTYDAYALDSSAPATVETGADFSARWTVFNVGDCAWDASFQLKPTGGPSADQRPAIPVGEIAPGNPFGPVAIVTAPGVAGTYEYTWQMLTPRNQAFGPRLTLEITVVHPGQSAPFRVPLDLWYVVPAILGAAWAMWRAGYFVTQMYSLKSAQSGLRFALASVFGLERTSVDVKPGEVVQTASGQDSAEPDEAGIKIGGPGWLSVAFGAAVVTERNGGFGRMLGPGEYDLSAFERVRLPFDIRKQTVADPNPEFVLTRDGIPVRVRVSTLFQIKPRVDTDPPSPPRAGFLRMLLAWLRLRRLRPMEAMPHRDRPPVSLEALRLATYELPAGIAWNRLAHGVAASNVRDALVERMLDDLFAPDNFALTPRQDIRSAAFEEGRSTLAGRDIELLDLSFDNIVVPDEVSEQRRRTWQVDWQKESTITKSAGEADGLLQIQLAQAEAQADLLESITHAIRTLDRTAEPAEATHPLALRFIDMVAQTIDRMLRNTSRENLSQSEKEMSDALKRLREVLEEKPAKSSP